MGNHLLIIFIYLGPLLLLLFFFLLLKVFQFLLCFVFFAGFAEHKVNEDIKL